VTQPIKTAFGALIYLGMPLFFIALPQTFFETGGNSICLIKFVFGIECYGCGMTRAFQHAIHLDFIGACISSDDLHLAKGCSQVDP
jgi:hypothetical protein